MTTALATPSRLFPTAAPSRPGGATLEQRLDRAWESLAVRASAACPVCGATMTLAEGRGACRGCGAELS